VICNQLYPKINRVTPKENPVQIRTEEEWGGQKKIGYRKSSLLHNIRVKLYYLPPYPTYPCVPLHPEPFVAAHEVIVAQAKITSATITIVRFIFVIFKVYNLPDE
jgi:hypothetical protein